MSMMTAPTMTLAALINTNKNLNDICSNGGENSIILIVEGRSTF